MEKVNPKVCLLGASFGTSNMGVNALTAGTLKAFFKGYPNGNLFLLDYGKKAITYNFQLDENIVPVELNNIRFSKKFYLKNNIALLLALSLSARCIPSSRVRKKIISSNFWLRRVAETDIVVSMAGGDSFSDIYGLRRFYYVALPQILALTLGKKLVLLPQTIGPFQGAVAKTIAKFIMRKAAVVYSRDQIGIGETKKLLGSGPGAENIRFCYDVGFVVDPIRPVAMDLTGLPEREGGNPPVVGFNVSGLLYMGGYTQNNMFGLKVDYRQLVREVIDHLIRRKGAAVLLIPHVFGTEHSESDSAVCETIYAELGQEYRNKLFTVRGDYNQHEIKYIIGLCDFFIGSRMHACIASLSQSIPAVSIAYSKKFFGVMHSIGVESLVADPRSLDKSDIINIIDAAYERRVSLREQLLNTIPHVKETVLNIFHEISALARLNNMP